jgi:ribose transport system permease protein
VTITDQPQRDAAGGGSKSQDRRPIRAGGAGWLSFTGRSAGLVAILVATIVLFAVSAVLAPQSVAPGALAGMLPFAAILAVVAIGQTLVIQQGGIDLSVPGAFSLSVVLVTKLPNGDNSMVLFAILLALVITAAAGLISGFVVAYLRVAPIVATLGMNALLVGATWAVSGGAARRTPDGLYGFISSSVFGVPVTVLFALGLTALMAFVIQRTVFGRRFETTGANPQVAAAAGIRPQPYQMSAYVVASVMYCLAGILLAGVVNTPGIDQGDAYLLPSVAVVVLGGTSLMGGKGSVVASTVAALFFTQVDRLVLTMGLGYGIQVLIQALALAVGVAFHGKALKEKLLRVVKPAPRAAVSS